jgi:hypothetical protein
MLSEQNAGRLLVCTVDTDSVPLYLTWVKNVLSVTAPRRKNKWETVFV